MSKKFCVIAVLGLFMASSCCCWDEQQREGAVTGGLLGAGAGMIIGSMTGSWVWGGLIGAGTGALAGYVVADNSHNYRRSPRVGDSYVVADDSRLRDEADREFRIAMESKDSASAEYHLRRSLELYPTPAAHNNLGLLQLQAGDREAARGSFRQAIILDPRYEPALQNLEKIGT